MSQREFQVGDKVIISAKCEHDGKTAVLRERRSNRNDSNDWYYDVLDSDGNKIDYCFGHTHIPVHERFTLVEAIDAAPNAVEGKPRNPRWTDWDMTAVRTPTDQEHDHVRRLCGDKGDRIISPYGRDICVNVSSIGGQYKYQHCSTDWYLEQGYTVITVAEFLKRLDIKETGSKTLTKEGENTMQVSPQEVRNLKLKEEDRLLIEAGFMHLSGERTQAYDEVLMDKIAAQFKDEVVADLKAIAKAKKAAK